MPTGKVPFRRGFLRSEYSLCRAILWCAAATMALSGEVTRARAGSGFVLRSQDTTTLGSANAGMSTETGNAGLMVNNPASLGWDTGRELVFTATPIFTTGNFANGAAGSAFGVPIIGGNGGNSGTKVLAPSVFAAADLTPEIRVAIGVTSLYGLGSTEQPGWIGRYYSYTSQLVTYDLLPAISYRPVSWFSVGVMPIVQYARAKTTSAIDFGTIDQVALGGVGGGRPGLDDGSVSTRTTGWAGGYELGALIEPLPGTRLGAAYRSQIRQSLNGRENFQTGGPVGDAVAAATGGFKSSDISFGLNLPATATVGVAQRINDALTVMADLQWMGWHTLHGLTITQPDPTQPPTVVNLDWHDSWFFAAGLRYRLNEQISLRAGAAYDGSPTRDSTRTPLIPDSDSYWASAGVEWRLTPATSLEAAYGHIFVTNGPVNLSAAVPANLFRGNLSGSIRGGVDYLSFQVVSRF